MATVGSDRVLRWLSLAAAWLMLSCCATAENWKDEAPPTDWASTIKPDVSEFKAASAPGDKPSEQGPLRLTLTDAILIALENNRSLATERISPSIQKTFEAEERSEFDPRLAAEISVERSDAQRQSQVSGIRSSTVTDVYAGAISLTEFFPTGTSAQVELSSQKTDSNITLIPFATTRLGLSVTQSLLRGYGTSANLARLRQARLDTRISRYELRGFGESLLARVEEAYWDYALAQRRIEIVDESLKIARQQQSETEEMIQVGTLAEAELAALQAEVASQQQALINAKSTLAAARLQLLRLLNPPGENLWEREVILVHPPALPEVELGTVATHVAAALRMRPEINQTKLGIARNDLEIVRTRNGLLPRLDLFITLGKTGYADSFGSSIRDLGGDGYDVMAGLSLEYPALNRGPGAAHRRARLRLDQAVKALDNLNQLVELDVRNAYIEVQRTKEQIAASTATRRLEEEKLRIETEKFRVGRSTNLFVAQAQRDLLLSRIGEVQAVVDYLKALTRFYLQEGSLLERRGIDAPGRKPATLPAIGQQTQRPRTLRP